MYVDEKEKQLDDLNGVIFNYLNPLIWIKYQKEISLDLLELFQDSFERYWIEINYK